MQRPKRKNPDVTRVLLIVALALLSSCEGRTSTHTDGPKSELRIVSLSPAFSRMLVDLGAEPFVVGRTKWCASLDSGVPVIGDLSGFDFESLVRIRPTHVVVQPPATGLDRELLRAADIHGFLLFSRAGLDSLEDIAETVESLAAWLDDGSMERRAETLAEALRDIDARADSDRRDNPLRVLIATIDADIRAFGSDTYLSEIFRAHGLVNAVEDSGWPALGMEDVARLQPDAIVIVNESSGEHEDVADSLGPLGRVECDAIRDGRIAVMRNPEALLPSTGLLEVDEEVAAIVQTWNERSSP